METPYNENLLVATSPDSAALIAAFSEEGGAPVDTGRRNQYNVGLQQGISRYIQVDTDYFWKYTDERLRLRRSVQYAGRISHQLAEVQDRRPLDPGEHGQPQGIPVVYDDGP